MSCRWSPVAWTLALLCLTACGSQVDEAAGSAPTSDSATTGFAGESWLSVDVTNAGRPFDLVPGTRVRLSLTADGLSADAGCNSMSGTASYADGVLDVTDDSLAITEMGCSGARMEQDTWLAELLTAHPHLELEAGRLVLSTADTTITFTERAPDDAPVSPDTPADPDTPTSN